MRSIALSLSRGTTALVIDHHTVHHAENTVSIHIEERDTTGKMIRGQDIDGVTVEELGSTGEIARAINADVLISFVHAASGLPAAIAMKPVPEVEAPAAPVPEAP